MWSHRAATTTYWFVCFIRQQVCQKILAKIFEFLACTKLAGLPPREKTPKRGSPRVFRPEIPTRRIAAPGKTAGAIPIFSSCIGLLITLGAPPRGPRRRPTLAGDPTGGPPVAPVHSQPAGPPNPPACRAQKKGGCVAAAAPGKTSSGAIRIRSGRPAAAASATGR